MAPEMDIERWTLRDGDPLVLVGAGVGENTAPELVSMLMIRATASTFLVAQFWPKIKKNKRPK